MPGLGEHAVEVLLAYAGSLVLIGGLVWMTLARARRVMRQVKAAEARDG